MFKKGGCLLSITDVARILQFSPQVYDGGMPLQSKTSEAGVSRWGAVRDSFRRLMELETSLCSCQLGFEEAALDTERRQFVVPFLQFCMRCAGLLRVALCSSG